MARLWLSLPSTRRTSRRRRRDPPCRRCTSLFALDSGQLGRHQTRDLPCLKVTDATEGHRGRCRCFKRALVPGVGLGELPLKVSQLGSLSYRLPVLVSHSGALSRWRVFSVRVYWLYAVRASPAFSTNTRGEPVALLHQLTNYRRPQASTPTLSSVVPSLAKTHFREPEPSKAIGYSCSSKCPLAVSLFG